MKFGWRDPDARPDGVALRSVLRWTLAGAVVAGLHAGGVWLALNREEASAAGEPPAAVMMEMAPLAVAPEAPPDQLPPDERMTETQLSPMEEQNDKPVERPEEKPEPVVVEAKKPVEDVLLPQTPPPEIETPKLPEVANAEVTLTPPPPQPKAARKPPPKKRRQSARSRKTGRWIAPRPRWPRQIPGRIGRPRRRRVRLSIPRHHPPHGGAASALTSTGIKGEARMGQWARSWWLLSSTARAAW